MKKKLRKSPDVFSLSEVSITARLFNSPIKIRYKINKDGTDWFPIIFRADCERTLPTHGSPDGESLFDLIEDFLSGKSNYRIVDCLEELERYKKP